MHNLLCTIVDYLQINSKQTCSDQKSPLALLNKKPNFHKDSLPTACSQKDSYPHVMLAKGEVSNLVHTAGTQLWLDHVLAQAIKQVGAVGIHQDMSNHNNILALCPGLPMFFNACEKNQEGLMMTCGHYLGRGLKSPPTLFETWFEISTYSPMHFLLQHEHTDTQTTVTVCTVHVERIAL